MCTHNCSRFCFFCGDFWCKHLWLPCWWWISITPTNKYIYSHRSMSVMLVGTCLCVDWARLWKFNWLQCMFALRKTRRGWFYQSVLNIPRLTTTALAATTTMSIQSLFLVFHSNDGRCWSRLFIVSVSTQFPTSLSPLDYSMNVTMK